jgi:hypothetical protein
MGTNEMQHISIEEIDQIAEKSLISIDSYIVENYIESIIDTYKQFCQSDIAKNLVIIEKQITDEKLLRLRFECLCLATFFLSLQSGNYFYNKTWFIKRPNQELIKLFDGAIASILIRLCEENEMLELKEINIESRPEFVLGEPLDPLNRIEEYRSTFVKKRGSEIILFGKKIGKALDAPNYPVLEIVGLKFGKQIFNLSNSALKVVLKYY